MDMAENSVAEIGGKADGRLGGKVLGGHGGGQADKGQERQKQGAANKTDAFPRGDSLIHHVGDNKGNKELKQSLQQLKQGTQHALFPVIMEITGKFLHKKKGS